MCRSICIRYHPYFIILLYFNFADCISASRHFTGNYPTLHWLLIVFPLLVLLIMTFGVGMILATIGVFFRDMEYLWEVALMIVMYTCAIFYYPERLLKSGYSWVLTVNPVYNVIINVRNIIFHEAFNWGA